MFSWHNFPYHRRRSWAERRYRPFAQWLGVVRHAKSTGKPHYYVKCADGNEVAITFKSACKAIGAPRRYILHSPAYTSGDGEVHTDIDQLNGRLISLGAIRRQTSASTRVCSDLPVALSE